MAYSPSEQLEKKYGLIPYEVSKSKTKYYKKDIGYGKHVHITCSGLISIDIRSNDGETLIHVAERYFCECPEHVDFILKNGRVGVHFNSL